MKDKRITVRLNELEQSELNLFMKNYHIEKESEALKIALKWCNHYITNVTNLFFPQNYEVHLIKKTKTNKVNRKVWD